jgi:dienelactone hydrolase
MTIMLPDLLTFADGRPVTAGAWPARRAEVLETVLDLQYGHLPPAPEAVTAEALHPYFVSREPVVHGRHYRVTAGRFSFLVNLVLPTGDGPFPAIVDGDGCWRGLTTEVLVAAAQRGYAMAIFNRVEIVPDAYHSRRDSGLYLAYPDGDFGALAAWAWGYSRVADLLLSLPEIDGTRLIATGHSRGGKTALLAGATDERFALTAPNNSGCGGAGCYRYPDEGGERLRDLMTNIPYWFSPKLAAYIDREEALPFDQHWVKALVAPRALLTTEALGDHWASPRGTRLTHEAAAEVYRLLGAGDSIGIYYREGGHAHGPADWEVLLDYADSRLFGKPSARDFDMQPWE